MKNKSKAKSNKKVFKLPKISLRKNASTPLSKSVLKAEREDSKFYHN